MREFDDGELRDVSTTFGYLNLEQIAAIKVWILFLVVSDRSFSEISPGLTFCQNW